MGVKYKLFFTIVTVAIAIFIFNVRLEKYLLSVGDYFSLLKKRKSKQGKVFESPKTYELKSMDQNQRRKFIIKKSSKNIKYEKNKQDINQARINFYQSILDKAKKDTFSVKVKPSKSFERRKVN